MVALTNLCPCDYLLSFVCGRLQRLTVSAVEPLAALVVRTPGPLANVVANRRRQLGMTERELADAAGVSRKLVCDAEAGKLTMQLDGLVKI